MLNNHAKVTALILKLIMFSYSCKYKLGYATETADFIINSSNKKNIFCVEKTD